MLDQKTLKEQIAAGLRDIVAPAIEECLLRSYPVKSNVGNKKAEAFKLNFDQLVSDKLAEVLAGAIDYYVRNAEIHGELFTLGKMGLNVLSIPVMSTSTPTLNGSVKGTLGIK